MNKIIISLALNVLLISKIFPQSLYDGLYTNRNTNDFICIKGDSISFNLNNFQSVFYYGKYHLSGDSFVLENNCALGNNTIISTSECDSNYMEIELVEWKHDFLIGEPIRHSKPYLSKSDLFSVCLCSKILQSNDTILRISKNQFSDMTFDSSFFFASGTMTGYLDDVSLPLSFGKRITLTQKHFNCQPAMQGDYPEIILKKKGKNAFLYYYNEKEKKMIRLKRRGKSESCLGELRKEYSDF